MNLKGLGQGLSKIMYLKVLCKLQTTEQDWLLVGQQVFMECLLNRHLLHA